MLRNGWATQAGSPFTRSFGGDGRAAAGSHRALLRLAVRGRARAADLARVQADTSLRHEVRQVPRGIALADRQVAEPAAALRRAVAEEVAGRDGLELDALLLQAFVGVGDVRDDADAPEHGEGRRDDPVGDDPARRRGVQGRGNQRTFARVGKKDFGEERL